MHRTVLVGTLVAAFAATAALHAESDPVKEFATLEDEYESSDQADEGLAARFQPRYEAFAAKYARSEEALTARLRLLEFTGALRQDAPVMNALAGRIVDDILANHPRSPQLGRLTEFWNFLAKDKADQVYRLLTNPEQPDAVKAAMLLWQAQLDEFDKKPEAAVPKYAEIVAKYKDVPRGITTYGEIADAKLHPHAASALAVGQPAPEIVGRSADGKPIRLSDFKGRVVVIDFFGDW